jgi:hypothetical protein
LDSKDHTDLIRTHNELKKRNISPMAIEKTLPLALSGAGVQAQAGRWHFATRERRSAAWAGARSARAVTL